jgi:hypothetical protein
MQQPKPEPDRELIELERELEHAGLYEELEALTQKYEAIEKAIFDALPKESLREAHDRLTCFMREVSSYAEIYGWDRPMPKTYDKMLGRN